MSKYIPLSEPMLKGKEWQYVKECLDSTWISSAGKYVNLFEKKIAEYTNAKYAVSCINGTSALHVALKLVGVMPGDEVIIPTITFIAPVNAVRYNGAEPIFMDADNYFNLDAEKTIAFIENETMFKNGYSHNKINNKRIAALILVHVYGNAVWLDEIVRVCEDRNIAIVEDAAESMGTVYSSGKFSGKHTGTIGKLGCLSFNGNKIITTGGGGMILTDNADLAEKAIYLTNQAKDDGVRYIHNEIGYNFRLTNIQAALGVAQLEQLPVFLKRKHEIFSQYQTVFDNITGFTLAGVPDYADNNHWMNLLQIDKEAYGHDRDMLMKHLEQNGIQSRPVWALNHLQKPYETCQSYQIERAEKLVEQSMCLPSSSNLKESEIQKVITTLHG
jgi:aminotransferase in exopolysaccharide biosynthesis